MVIRSVIIHSVTRIVGSCRRRHEVAPRLCDGGQANQGNFAQSARVQEIINAVERSHRERRWVDLPLEPGVGD